MAITLLWSRNFEKKNGKLQTIKILFQVLALLRMQGVIRSDVIFGDIGEYLCTIAFPGLALVEEKTKEGYDALLDGKKVQIKFSNSADTKNIDLGKPKGYEELIVVLGPNSAHRMANDSNADFLFYKYTIKEVKKKFAIKSGCTLSKTKHFHKSAAQYSMQNS